jgi:riboflavin kinase/FMN adenylyltransferase
VTILPWERLQTASAGLPPAALGPVALTIGVFDGIHLGHQRLLREIAADPAEAAPAVCSFRQNPGSVLGTRPVPGSILSLPQKIRKFAAFGVQFLVLIDFSVEISTLTGEDFLAVLGRAFDIRRLVVGYNFHMGRGRATGVGELESLLKPRSTRLTVVPAEHHSNRVVSSSRIRESIVHGRFQEAREMLGGEYCLDLEGLQPEGEGSVARLAGSRVGQVLPAPGSYRAALRGEGRSASARVTITGEAIEWESRQGFRVTEICFSE